MKVLIGVPESNSNLSAEEIKQHFEESAKTYQFDLALSTDNLTSSELDEVEVYVGNNIAVLTQLLERPHSQLRWVQTLSAGIDNLPLTRLQEKGIRLTTVKGIHAEPISESVIGMILAMYRGINESAQEGQWFKLTQTLKMLQGKQVVIYGTGHIGGRIAEILTVFHAKTIGINSSGHEAKGFQQVVSMADSQPAIENADILVNALPLTPQTKHLFNADLFKQLKRQPLFINIGRGPSVNTSDLVQALDTKQLSGAALDVTDPEPLPKDHALWQKANVLITPHISGIHAEYLAESLAIFNHNMTEFVQNGQVVQNQVDYKKGY